RDLTFLTGYNNKQRENERTSSCIHPSIQHTARKNTSKRSVADPRVSRRRPVFIRACTQDYTHLLCTAGRVAYHAKTVQIRKQTVTAQKRCTYVTFSTCRAWTQ
ncbi:unnamed protein product, partial [Ectocarpus sp. 8 AP-2014]